MGGVVRLLVLAASSTAALSAGATTLEAGAGKPYATPCLAIAAAHANDEVDVAPGTYADSCEINVQGLTVKGVGGRPKVDLSGTNHPVDYKGIFVISADDVRIENLELMGAHVDDGQGGNAAALRVTGRGIVVHGCNIHDNQNGVLAAPIVDGGSITIEYTELAHNGLGDECDHDGCTHNVYVSKNGAIRYDKTVFQYNWSHDLASDTADKGHLFKSRSRETDVLYNRITGETGHDSYEVDIPNAGVAVVVGNLIEKGTNPDNSILLNYGEEGLDSGQGTSLYVAFNTFVNDSSSGTFVRLASGTTLTAHDNLFVGPGTPSSAGALSADNLGVDKSVFVNASAYDYHLVAGASPIGKAASAGTAGSFPLTAAFEYVHPLLSVARSSARDLGAYEYGTSTSLASTDAGGGTASVDAGASTDGGGDSPVGTSDGSTDAGSVVTGRDGGSGRSSGDGTAADGTAAGSSGGCGCLLGGYIDRSQNSLGVVAVALGLAFARRRRGR